MDDVERIAAGEWRPPNTFLLANNPSPLVSQPKSLGLRRLRVAQHLKQENAK